MATSNISGNFEHDPRDDDDEKPKRRSRESRIKDRAKLLAGLEVGDQEEWERYKDVAGDQIKYEDYEFFLAKRGWKFDVAYNYVTPDHKLLYECRRFNFELYQTKKIFVISHREGLVRVRGAGPVRLPFNLPALVATPDRDIELVEGEKGVEALKKLGLLASCVQGQNWTGDVAQCFAGRHVNVNMDNDDAGQKNILRALDALRKVGAIVRIVELPDLGPQQGLDDWLEKHSVDEYRGIVALTPIVGRINAGPHSFPEEGTLERYDWLHGRHLLRGEVVGTAAAGGTGKSNLGIIEALSQATGKSLTHDVVPRPVTVVLINLEDSRATMNKRIAAVMRHYNITKEDVGGRLIVLAKGEIKFKIARQKRGGDVERNEDAIKMLTSLMLEHRADVLSIDSFIRTHSVPENDNNSIEQVIECYEEIAQGARCGVHLWHHTRKGGKEGATIESSRGAQAFIDACRSVRILETMNAAQHNELEKLMEGKELPPAGYFFRVFNGKRNFAPPAEDSKWFKYESIKLRNYRSEFEDDGDNIGVVTTFEYPEVAQPIVSLVDIQRAQDLIAKGGPWRLDQRAAKWVGYAIAEALGLDDKTSVKAVRKMIDKIKVAWIRDDYLREEPGLDARREPTKFVVVGRPAAGVGEPRREK